jgi:uncharacterized coiled-coil protein SlyX
MAAETEGRKRFFEWFYANVITLVVLIAAIAGTFYTLVYKVGSLEDRLDALESRVAVVETRLSVVEKELSEIKGQMGIINYKLDLLLEGKTLTAVPVSVGIIK